MQLLEKLKHAFLYRQLKNALKKQPKSLIGKSFEAAKTVGILFQTEDLETEKNILLFAESLKEKGKKVYLLAFTEKSIESTGPYSVITKKETDWLGRPKKESAADSWLQKELDCIMSLSSYKIPALDYVLAKGKARMRVGMRTDQPWLFDVMIEGVNNDIRKNLLFLSKILQTIKSSSYEPVI